MNIYLLESLGNNIYKFGILLGCLPDNRRYQKDPNLLRSEI